jgi:hypothetical protein
MDLCKQRADDRAKVHSDVSTGAVVALLGCSFDKAPNDLASGTIYVLRSKSDHPVVAANRDVLHKIGVTGGKVETRLINTSLDLTFLMAEVEVVATYDLYNINRIAARLVKVAS